MYESFCVFFIINRDVQKKEVCKSVETWKLDIMNDSSGIYDSFFTHVFICACTRL